MTQKILFIAQGLDGGIANICVSLANKLIENNWDAHIVFVGKSVKGRLCRKGTFTYKNIDLGFYKGLLQFYSLLKKKQNILKEVADFAPSIIVCAGIIPAMFYSSMLKRKFKVPIIMWEHGPQHTFTKLKWVMLYIASRYIEGYLSVSNSSKEVFLSQFPYIKKNKCQVIENGIDFSVYRESSKMLDLENGLRVIMPARLDSVQKDHMSLIRAAHNLINKGYELTVTFAGAGPAEKAIVDDIHGLDLENNIKLLGHVTNLEKELDKYNVVCLATKWEGFGLVLVESMGVGLLTLGSNVTGVKDVIIHDKTGILFSPESVKSLEAALENVFKDPKKYSQVAKNGHIFAREHFSIELMAKRFTNYLMKFLN